MSTQIFWRDPSANLLTVIGDYARLEYGRAEGKVGFLTLDLDPSQIPISYLIENARLEPWRQVGALSPYLDGEAPFFLLDWNYQIDQAGLEVLHLECLDTISWLDWHTVAYKHGTAQADKTDNADDMMKAYVRENMGTLATDTARDLSAWMTVQADDTLAPSTTRTASRKKLLEVFQELAAESLQQGTYLTYDIVCTGPTMLEFRTYIGQRGINHGRTSSLPVVISRERRNLEEPVSRESHSAERNFVYAGYQDTGGVEEIQTASTADALGINRREIYIEGNNFDAAGGLVSVARAALFENRAKRALTGKIIDVDGCQDGVQYRYGDVVYAEYGGQGFDAHYDVMHRIVEGGSEKSDCRIRSES